MPSSGDIAEAYLAGGYATGSPIADAPSRAIRELTRRYGFEYVIDLKGCDARQFTIPAIKMFMPRICAIFRLTPAQLHIWCYEDPHNKAAAPPHLKGVSAVQFITTSNITLHCLDDLGLAMVNVFTCGVLQQHDIARGREFCMTWFNAKSYTEHLLNRG